MQCPLSLLLIVAAAADQGHIRPASHHEQMPDLVVTIDVGGSVVTSANQGHMRSAHRQGNVPGAAIEIDSRGGVMGETWEPPPKAKICDVNSCNTKAEPCAWPVGKKCRPLLAGSINPELCGKDAGGHEGVDCSPWLPI